MAQGGAQQGGEILGAGMQPAAQQFERCEKVECPQTLVGRLIGKQGETIKDLQRRSGARIQIDQNFPDGQPRIVTVEGSVACVEVGCELVRSLIGNSPAVGNGTPGQMTTMECPKQLVVRVIGKGGETINELQRRSGARIQIEQRVADGCPCIVEIQGDDSCVAEAVRLTTEVMSGRRLESTAPTIAGYGAYGGQAYGMEQAYGMDPYAMQQMAAYGMQADPYNQAALYQQQYAQQYQQQYQQQQQQAYAAYAADPAAYAAAQAAQGQTAAGAAAAPAGGAAGWTSHLDPQGRTYWHNLLTQESTWETPPGQ